MGLNIAKEFFDCECGCKLILIDKFENEICFTMYEILNTQTDWIHNIKLAWKVLTTGKPYTDTVILTTEKTKELIEHLTKLITPNV